MQQLCRHDPPSVKSVHQPTMQPNQPFVSDDSDWCLWLCQTYWPVHTQLAWITTLPHRSWQANLIKNGVHIITILAYARTYIRTHTLTVSKCCCVGPSVLPLSTTYKCHHPPCVGSSLSQEWSSGCQGHPWSLPRNRRRPHLPPRANSEWRTPHSPHSAPPLHHPVKFVPLHIRT